METGQVVLEPLTYIRGRSIPHQFMIVDESPEPDAARGEDDRQPRRRRHQARPHRRREQIDNPYLDCSSNGLSYLVERLKGKGIVGHVTLAKSERSELASLVTAEL